jgi:hypothetical protein
MFSIGGALNALTNAANMAGGNTMMARTNWIDPAQYWTPERLANQARNNAGAPTQVYQRQEIGGEEAQFQGRGKGGTAVASGYNALGKQTGDAPRAARSSMAGLQRAAARGSAGWKAGGWT